MNCPVCLGPMAWSEDRGRLWCAVYGDHPARTPSRLLERADAELYAVQPVGVAAPHGRRAA